MWNFSYLQWKEINCWYSIVVIPLYKYFQIVSNFLYKIMSEISVYCWTETVLWSTEYILKISIFHLNLATFLFLLMQEHLAEERKELESQRETYQQDLERLRESTRAVEKEKERLEHQKKIKRKTIEVGLSVVDISRHTCIMVDKTQHLPKQKYYSMAYVWRKVSPYITRISKL